MLSIVRNLLKYESSTSPSKTTLQLFDAIEKDDPELCLSLINDGANIKVHNKQISDSYPVLCWAIECLAKANKLINANLESSNNNNAKEPTAHNDDRLKVVKLLLEHKANPLQQSLTSAVQGYGYVQKTHNTAIHLAVIYQDAELLALLLQNCKYQEVQNNHHQTPLDLAAKEHPSILALLLAQQHKVSLKGPLQQALQGAKLDNVLLLLEQMKIEELHPTKLGYNIMEQAITFGNIDIIDLLLKRNLHKFPDTFALHMAVRAKEEHLIHLLKTGLFDINQKDNFGQTPLVEASKRASQAVNILLQQPGVNVDILSSNNVGVVFLLITSGRVETALEVLKISNKQANTQTMQTTTPLHALMNAGVPDSKKLGYTKALVEHGADPSLAPGILYATAQAGLVDVLEYLLGELTLNPLEGLATGTTALCGSVLAPRSRMLELIFTIFVYGGITTATITAKHGVRTPLDMLAENERIILYYYSEIWSQVRILWIAWLKGHVSLEDAVGSLALADSSQPVGFDSLPWPVIAEIIQYVLGRKNSRWNPGSPPQFSFSKK